MSIPSMVKHTGVLVSSTSANSCGPRPASDAIDTGFTATYAAAKGGQFDLTTGSPVSLPFENIAKVRVLQMTVSGNSLTLLLTSAAGTDQAIRLSAGVPLLLHLPSLGDELTAIKVQGNGASGSYFIAGDHA
jgi:hypothetical protein